MNQDGERNTMRNQPTWEPRAGAVYLSLFYSVDPVARDVPHTSRRGSVAFRLRSCSFRSVKTSALLQKGPRVNTWR